MEEGQGASPASEVLRKRIVSEPSSFEAWLRITLALSRRRLPAVHPVFTSQFPKKAAQMKHGLRDDNWHKAGRICPLPAEPFARIVLDHVTINQTLCLLHTYGEDQVPLGNDRL
jgi:hypothetical protein